MGPFIGISSCGILLAILAVFTRWRHFGTYALIALTAFMCLWGALSGWAVGFGPLPPGPLQAYAPVQGWIGFSMIITLACVVAYLVILLVGLKGQRAWAWTATLVTSIAAAVFGAVPSVLHQVLIGERASGWIRVILAIALLIILFTRPVKEVFPKADQR